ncbi:MAG: hypothetical protein AAGB46_11060 [Verrucomicrobiota bacterium]
MLDDGEQALGSVAIGDFGEGLFGELEQFGAGVFEGFEEGLFVFSQEALGREVDFDGNDVFLDGSGSNAKGEIGAPST